MRHRRRVKHFSRKSTARKALIRGLMISLVEHGRISTTVEKAKELRRHIEPIITLGKKGDLATRRLLMSRIPNEKTVESILGDIAPRMKTRAGGYTRIIKIGRRPGDTAEMAFIEFVDYDYENPKSAEKAEKVVAKKDAKDAKEAKPKAKAKTAKKAVSALVAKKKSVKKKQSKSRKAARA